MQVWHRLPLEQKTFIILAGFFFIASLNPLVMSFLQEKTSNDVAAEWQRPATGTSHLFGLAISMRREKLKIPVKIHLQFWEFLYRQHQLQ